MRIRNLTQYDTRALRRVVTATRQITEAVVQHRLSNWKRLTLVVRYERSRIGTRAVRKAHEGGAYVIDMTVPPLSGEEWIALTRERHGAPLIDVVKTTNRPLLAVELIARLYTWLSWQQGLERGIKPRSSPYAFWGVAGEKLIWSYGRDAARRKATKLVQTLPALLPLKSPSRRKPARDLQRERYERLLAREKQWTTRAKLAATKLKNIRQQRRAYERRMAKKEQQD